MSTDNMSENEILQRMEALRRAGDAEGLRRLGDELMAHAEELERVLRLRQAGLPPARPKVIP